MISGFGERACREPDETSQGLCVPESTGMGLVILQHDRTMKKTCALCFALLVSIVSLQNADAKKRPRDAYIEPEKVSKEKADEIIAAVVKLHTALKKGEYANFYEHFVDPEAQKEIGKQEFVKRMEQASLNLQAFMLEAVNRYKKRGHQDDDFQIGESPYDEDTYIVQFADRIDDESRKPLPEGLAWSIWLKEHDGMLKLTLFE